MAVASFSYSILRLVTSLTKPGPQLSTYIIVERCLAKLRSELFA